MNNLLVATAWALRQDEGMDHVIDKDRIVNCWKALTPHFGHRLIPTIKQKDINTYRDARLAKGLALSTVRRELVELTTTFNFMVDTRRIASTELPVVKLPALPVARAKALSDDQRTLVLAEAAAARKGARLTRLELFLHIGLETGQRKEAIETLEWDQVDWAAGRIHFQREGEIATKKRKASVPMSDRLLAVLQAEAQVASTPYVLRNPGDIRTSFDNLMAACGLPEVTPHWLRHTFVSSLLMRNKSVYDVATVVGMTVKMVEQTYGHLTTEHLRNVLN